MDIMDSRVAKCPCEKEQCEKKPKQQKLMSADASCGIRQMYDDGQLCDVHITIDGQTIDCHRVVLAAHSDYFKKMFVGFFY